MFLPSQALCICVPEHLSCSGDPKQQKTSDAENHPYDLIEFLLLKIVIHSPFIPWAMDGDS